ISPRLLRAHRRTMEPRPLLGNSDGFALSKSAAPGVWIGVGVARPLILAVRIGVEEGAITRLGYHLLGRRRCCDRGRQDGHRAKKLEGRHCVSPLECAPRPPRVYNRGRCTLPFSPI